MINLSFRNSHPMLFCAVAIAGLLVVAAAPARAVTLSVQGRGAALILPLVNTEAGMDSLVTVSGGSAVKIHVRDRYGALVKSFSVYPDGNWVASLSAQAQAATLRSPGSDCVLVGESGSTSVADADMALDFTIGYLEIIQMGIITEETVNEAIESGNCEALVERWNTGAWSTAPNDGLAAPEEMLRATVALIDVGRGALYSLRATALSNFSDIPQHAAPTAPVPNLSTPHDAGTDSGATASRVCYQGQCYEDTWSSPRDAVAAALMTHELLGDYVVDPAINAATTWVINYPMQPYYPEESVMHSARVELAIEDRDGELLVPEGRLCILPTPAEGFFLFCDSTFVFEQEFSLGLIAFNKSIQPDDAPALSRILGVPTQVPSIYHPEFPVAGEARIGFDSMYQPVLVSNSGREYFGRPALGFSLEEYVNGVLQDDSGQRIRANYGGAFELSRKGRVSE